VAGYHRRGVGRSARTVPVVEGFMFGLGMQELLLIFVILILIFGTSRIPELGRGLGEGIKNFKKSIKGDEEPQKKP
jgi:sec-independent protein translocase protein TatA